MGFYSRKSVKVGPLRFNLSKSGVGVSAGVRGLRFGTGPRGNYVHMGRHGIYYRATLPPGSPGAQPEPERPPRAERENEPSTHEPLREIESAAAAQIVDSSSRELLQELNDKRRRPRLWPVVLAVTLLAVFVVAAMGWPGWVALLVLLIGVGLTWITYQRDLLAKTAVLLYDLEPEWEAVYGRLHRSAQHLASCSATWHIEAEGRVRDRKYHGGATNLVSRKPTFIKTAAPPFVKTNVETIAMGVGRQTLYFFPDRLLVYEANSVGGVAYPNLSISAHASRFIEDGHVPTDAKVVDSTWQYVKKSGGPDRRFKDNRQLPICEYEELVLQSATGLNEIIQVSRCHIAGDFAQEVRRLASRMPA